MATQPCPERLRFRITTKKAASKKVNVLRIEGFIDKRGPKVVIIRAIRWLSVS
jgi:hypothetical protein